MSNRKKFLGRTWSVVEIMLLLGLFIFAVYNHFSEPAITTAKEVPVTEVESALDQQHDDDLTKVSVDVWLMKYQLDFDRTDAVYQDGRERRFFRNSYFKKCMKEKASKGGQLLTYEQVQKCLEQADDEALEAQAYWKKR